MAYREKRTLEIAGASLALVAAALFAVGWMTRQDPAEKPWLEIAGGGFVFNYRVAEVFYGFTALVLKPLPVGSVIVAEFEDPSGGPPLVVEKRVNARTNRYGIRSPAIRGVKADKPYHVSIRLYDRTKSELLWSAERTYASRIGDNVVPEKPLTIGPGYHLNPEAPENRAVN